MYIIQQYIYFYAYRTDKLVKLEISKDYEKRVDKDELSRAQLHFIIISYKIFF